MDDIAFLGAGSMATAVVEGLLARGDFAPDHLVCMGGSGSSGPALSKKTGIRLAASLDELLERADTLVVAFKPQHLSSADPRLAVLSEGRLVISVLAGKKLTALSAAFPKARNIVRSMPNTPAQIGAGLTAWCAQTPLDRQDQTTLDRLFGALGKSIELPEAQIDSFTAISGSGPAYVFEFAAALRDAGQSLGFDPLTARFLAVETLLGASRLLARSEEDPEVLRAKVTSPNGVTAAGLRCMSDLDFRGLIRATVQAARVRAETLSA